MSSQRNIHFSMIFIITLLVGCREEIDGTQTFVKEYGYDGPGISSQLVPLQNGNYEIIGAVGQSVSSPIENNQVYHVSPSYIEITEDGSEVSLKQFPIVSAPSLPPLYEISDIDNKSIFLDQVIHEDGSKSVIGHIRGARFYVPFLNINVPQYLNYRFPFVFRISANDRVIEKRFFLTEQSNEPLVFGLVSIDQNNLGEYAILLGDATDAFNFVNRPGYTIGYRLMIYDEANETILDRALLDTANLRLVKSIHLDDNGNVFMLGQLNDQTAFYKLDAALDYQEEIIPINDSGMGELPSPTGLPNYPRFNDNAMLLRKNNQGFFVMAYTRPQRDVFVDVISSNLSRIAQQAINGRSVDEYAQALCIAGNDDIIVGTRVVQTFDPDNLGYVYRLDPELNLLWKIDIEGFIKDIKETPEGDLLILHDFLDRNGIFKTHVTKLTRDGKLY